MRQDVSRETIEALEHYQEMVKKWSTKINLVSKSSIDDLWARHIEDSAQIFDASLVFSHWVDLGSGGGFPGIVVSIMASEAKTGACFTLIESDQRKATFLKSVVRELGLNVSVISERIEVIPRLEADVVSARALSPLVTLLGLVDRHLKADGLALLMKGEMWRSEHAKAMEEWSYQLDAIKSESDPKAAVLAIRELRRA